MKISPASARAARIGALSVLTLAAFSAPLPAAAPAAGDSPLADGAYLFFDVDGARPEPALVKRFAEHRGLPVHVIGVTRDPEETINRLARADATLVELTEAFAAGGGHLDYSLLDPDAAGTLVALGSPRLPAVVVVEGGRIHVRAGAGDVDLSALRACKGGSDR